MEQNNGLVNDLDTFQLAVKRLSESINKCGADWSDAQFKSLSDAIKIIATSSKQVISAGANCENAIKRFQKIESE